MMTIEEFVSTHAGFPVMTPQEFMSTDTRLVHVHEGYPEARKVLEGKTIILNMRHVVWIQTLPLHMVHDVHGEQPRPVFHVCMSTGDRFAVSVVAS